MGCSSPPATDRPSMVVTWAPSQERARMVQDLTARPSRWTTQAPHCDVSQPTCVPVKCRFSLRNWTSKVRGSMSALAAFPFTITVTPGINSSLILLEQSPATGSCSRSLAPKADECTCNSSPATAAADRKKRTCHTPLPHPRLPSKYLAALQVKSDFCPGTDS